MNRQTLSGTHLSTFLTKKLSRQEFLTSLGILVVSITGIAGFLKTLAQLHIPHRSPDATSSFSSGSYGGTDTERRNS